jgi:hypothetical protein
MGIARLIRLRYLNEVEGLAVGGTRCLYHNHFIILSVSAPCCALVTFVARSDDFIVMMVDRHLEYVQRAA